MKTGSEVSILYLRCPFGALIGSLTELGMKCSILICIAISDAAYVAADVFRTISNIYDEAFVKLNK